MTVLGRELAALMAGSGILKPSLLTVDGGDLVVDTRGLGTRPAVEALVSATIASNATDAEVSLLAGVANSGTVWASLAARAAGLPHCNVLVDGPRAKGLGRRVEPDDIAGHTVALVDNWVSSGSSLRTARRVVESLGATVRLAIVISAAHDLDRVGDLDVRVLWPRDLLELNAPAPESTTYTIT
ncbi:MAG: phosphoribosyltransferase [Nocardioides sp.]|nr:phosphoribosyltransferase [Nocardioides sp.]